MRYIAYLLYILFLLFISSCNQEKQKIKCIYDSTIRFPERMEIWRGNEKAESHYHQNAPIKLVMYYSDIECSPCAINNLKEYNDIYKKTGCDTLFSPIIIFSLNNQYYSFTSN